MLLIHIIVVVKSEHEYINSCFCMNNVDMFCFFNWLSWVFP